MWPLDWSVMWLCGWGPFILSHNSTTFEIHRPCESGYITSFICHVIKISKCHVTFWVGSSRPNSPPWPYGTRNNDFCNISSNPNSISNSNSNAEIPMPRFTNGLNIMRIVFRHSIIMDICISFSIVRVYFSF